MFCIQVPIREMSCPPKNRRKLRWRSERMASLRREGERGFAAPPAWELLSFAFPESGIVIPLELTYLKCEGAPGRGKPLSSDNQLSGTGFETPATGPGKSFSCP